MVSSNILTNTVRVIGCICLVGSVMVLTQLVSDLVHQRNGNVRKEIDAIGIWTLHCGQFLRGESHRALMAGYTLVYCLSSSLLIVASYMKYRLLVFPWLVCEGLCIVSDGLAVIAVFSGKKLNVDKWQMGAMMFGLCFTLITWGVVFEALRVWGLEKQRLRREGGAPPPPYTEHSLEQPPCAGTPRSASRFYTPSRTPRREFACKTYAL